MITPSGTASYNGYTFDGSTSITCRCEAMDDEAGRVVVYHRNVFNFKFTVGGAITTTDLTMQQIRFLLLQKGGPFIISGLGLGTDLRVNTPGGTSDVMWGPSPRIVSWTPSGYTRSADVEWEVVVCTAACNQTIGYGYQGSNRVMAVNYGVDFSINERGFSERSISGHVKIFIIRNGRLVQDSVDRYRDLIRPDAPPNFQRRQRWSTSPDNTRLDFSINDTQIESRQPYPGGMVKASGSHDVSWTRSNQGAMTLRNTISVELEPMLGIHPVMAYIQFGLIVKGRIQAAKNAGKSVLIDELRIREDLFGTTHGFSCSYRILARIEDIVGASGLWNNLGYTWPAWANSITAARRNRGLENLIYSPSNDTIVDLCTFQSSAVSSPQQGYSDQKSSYALFKNEQPKQDQSWVQYQMGVKPLRKQPVSRQSYSQTPETDSASGNMNDASGYRYDAASSTAKADILSIAGNGQYGITLFGNAIRAGYPIPRPVLTSMGGQDAVEVVADFASIAIGSYFGVPVYAAKWSIEYALGKAPLVVTPPDNTTDAL